MDAADQHQNNLEKDVIKRQLNEHAMELGTYKDIHLEDIKGPDYCGSCGDMKLADPSGKPICCNSCSSVFAAHEHLGKPAPNMEDIEQCRLENWPDLIKNHANEGCRITGKFNVNKVSGNFHFAAGKSFDIRGNHIHDVRFLDGLHLDFAHKIHHLSFGQRHAQLKNPLDNKDVPLASIGEVPKVHSYYVKVVSTAFKHINGLIMSTNQFSATRNTHEAPTQVPSIINICQYCLYFI